MSDTEDTTEAQAGQTIEEQLAAAKSKAQRFSGEAAAYRVERNAALGQVKALTEERDHFVERVERLQRADIERIAGDRMSQPADLFSLTGNSVADYLDELGEVDPEKVTAGAEAVLASRPGLGKAAPRGFDPSQGTGGVLPKAANPTMLDLLKS